MASITIRKLDDSVKRQLRRRAAEHGHSLEQEVRNILNREVGEKITAKLGIGEAIRQRFAPLGGVELPLPIRRGRKVPDLG